MPSAAIVNDGVDERLLAGDDFATSEALLSDTVQKHEDVTCWSLEADEDTAGATSMVEYVTARYRGLRRAALAGRLGGVPPSAGVCDQANDKQRPLGFTLGERDEVDLVAVLSLALNKRDRRSQNLGPRARWK